MHLCGWFPDGQNRCNEPANKCVSFMCTADQQTWDDGIPSIWLCDYHYQDERLVKFWKNMNLRPLF